MNPRDIAGERKKTPNKQKNIWLQGKILILDMEGHCVDHPNVKETEIIQLIKSFEGDEVNESDA